MMEPWIIADILKREEEQRREQERRQPELTIERDYPATSPPKSEPESDRGVAIIDI